MDHIKKHIPIIKDFVKTHSMWLQVFSVCVIIFISLIFFSLAPSSKNDQINVDVLSGLSLMQISSILKDNNVIRSEAIFRAIVILSGGENSIKAGPYLFSGEENVFRITYRLMKADYGVPVKKITVIEGMRSRDILTLFSAEFINIDKVELERELLSREGYLFPDTYFIPIRASSSDVLKMLSDNFEKHISEIDFSKSLTTSNLNEIITMASIIEGEAQKDEDRKIIADILWRRMSIGMPLQVDTTFMYIMNKPSSLLTKADLRIDSPYNTYVNKGLPPTPISNPGILAIKSVMFPTSNKYLYYLSDKNGTMHYAETFAEHKKNKEKYLK